MRQLPLIILFFLAGFVFSSTAVCQSIDGITIIKLSPADKTAVIKRGKEGLKVVRVGDALSKTATITGITDNRITLKQTVGDVSETIIIRLDDKGQAIERIRSAVPEEETVMYIPLEEEPDNGFASEPSSGKHRNTSVPKTTTLR